MWNKLNNSLSHIWQPQNNNRLTNLGTHLTNSFQIIRWVPLHTFGDSEMIIVWQTQAPTWQIPFKSSGGFPFTHLATPKQSSSNKLRHLLHTFGDPEAIIVWQTQAPTWQTLFKSSGGFPFIHLAYPTTPKQSFGNLTNSGTPFTYPRNNHYRPTNSFQIIKLVPLHTFETSDDPETIIVWHTRHPPTWQTLHTSGDPHPLNKLLSNHQDPETIIVWQT